MKSLSVHIAFVFSIMAADGSLRAQQTPAAAPSASTPTNGLGPRIEFATPVYDWGRVAEGEPVKHDFVFTNTGDAQLEVTGVVPGCHCTQAGEYTKHVAPGKTGVIPIQFNSSGYPAGSVGKVVTVTCNDKSQSTLYLQIKGTIWRRISYPATVILTLIDDPTSTATQVVDIVNNMDPPITVSDPEIGSVSPKTTNRIYSAALKTVKPGKEFQLTIKAAQPVGTRNALANIRMKTSSTNAPEISINAFVTVNPALELKPDKITLPAGPLTNTQSYLVSIQNNGSHPVKLSEPAVNANGADVQLKEVESGRQYLLTVTFRAGSELASGDKAEVTVKSDLPQSPVIKVPVIQLPKPPSAGGH